jgi:hypothetical protein
MGAGAIQIGALGELMVAEQLTERGWTCCVPMVGGNGSHYDLVVTKGCTVHRIQVKASAHHPPQGGYSWTTSKGSQTKDLYSQSDFDFIVCVFVMKPAVYLVMPIDLINTKFTVKTKEGGKWWPWLNRWDILDQ